MSDAIEPRPAMPFPADAPPVAAAGADPLAGEWSEGLRSAVRALGIPEPKLISLDGSAQRPDSAPPRASSEPPAAAAGPADEVDAPDAWASATEDSLSEPPPAAQLPDRPQLPDTTPPSPSPAFAPEATPLAPAAAFVPDTTPPSPAPAFIAEPSLPAPAPAPLADVTPATPAPAF